MSRSSTISPPREPKLNLDDVQHIVLDGISWDFYERLLEEIGNRPIRVTYDQGMLEMMAPLSTHEDGKKFVARMIEMLSFVLADEMKSGGSATFRSKAKQKGLEPDECYFFKHPEKVRGIREWKAGKHPPPDLAVEIDITNRSVDREPIYAALGVAEIWRWDGLRLECLHLYDGKYVIRKHSLVFPFLEPAQLVRFINKSKTKGENAVLKEFVDWVKKNGWAK